MEMQTVFNAVLGVAAFLCGWVLNNITKAIERLDSDVRAMPVHYVAKEDYKEDIQRIHEMLDKIFCKLDNKADK
jgi:hypothetical protein